MIALNMFYLVWCLFGLLNSSVESLATTLMSMVWCLDADEDEFKKLLNTCLMNCLIELSP